VKKNVFRYVARFILLYTIVYFIVGMISYQLFDYEKALKTIEHFELFRPLGPENPAMAGVVFLGCIIRGGILSLFLYPFFGVILVKKHGWFLLFAILFCLTALGSPIFLHNLLDPEAISEAGSIGQALNELKYGVPEITLQMFLFSLGFFFWERKKNKPV
jgi:hypothetical protein